MITIKNNQRTVKVDTKQLKKIMQQLLDCVGYSDFDIGIMLASDATIRTYNKTYRNKDAVTDILSFPYHTTLKPGDAITVAHEEDKNLGDLIIAPSYVGKDAPNWNQTLPERMKVLLVHGVCHLLGYDHETENEYDVMHKKEIALLNQLEEIS
jgi:probable rRNA maturation factor